MKRLLLAFALLGLVAGASADPNDLTGGVLITHAPSGVIFSAGLDYCGAYAEYGIASCEEQNTTMVSGGAPQHMFFYVVAAFAEDKVWCGTQFGFGDVTGTDEYFYFVAGGDANICLTNALSTTSGAGFPMENEGIAIVATDIPWDGNFLPVYWAECYSYYAGGDYIIPLGVYPGDPPLAVFGNCEVPSIIWDIECLGAMGVGAEPGVQCCPPDAPIEGACCLTDGSCQDLEETDCINLDGDWLGEGTDCDTAHCAQPFGACCLEDGSCQDLTEDDCLALTGVWEGMGTACATTDCPQPTVCCVGVDCYIVFNEQECDALQGMWYPGEDACEPNPCEIVPTNGDTWGSIKILYR